MKNVVLLTIDALRKDAVGCYGGGDLTPFIDSLQDRTIRFNNAHSPGPYTQAAFPAILTSSYYLEYGRQKMLSGKRVLISEVLKKAGIETAGCHSNAYLCEYFGWNRGWDFFYDSMEEDVDDKVPYIKARPLNERVGNWLRSRKEKDNPFFLWLHYMDVHEPYVPERKYVETVDPSIDITEDQMFSLFSDVLMKRDVSDKKAIELIKKLYLAHVREVDEAVEEFFGILEKLNCLNDTVIIITSDHGDEFNEHSGLSHDGKMFSELVAVPLVIYDSTLDKGKVCDTLVSTIDVSPTIAHLFGLDPVDAFEGHSLLLLGDYPIKGVYGEAFDKYGNHETGKEKEVYYYLEGDFKIIYRETDDSWKLYDLKVDPGELNNIMDSSEHASHMKQKLIPRIKRHLR